MELTKEGGLTSLEHGKALQELYAVAVKAGDLSIAYAILSELHKVDCYGYGKDYTKPQHTDSRQEL